MPLNVTQKLIKDHLVSGEMEAGEQISISIDRKVTQDARGTTVMLELEAKVLDRTTAEASAQYIDQILIHSDNKDPDDHIFLESAAQWFGVYYIRAAN